MAALQEERSSDGVIHIIYVVPPGDKYQHQVYRFLTTLDQFDPGADYSLHVVNQGNKLSLGSTSKFKSVDAKLIVRWDHFHDNSYRETGAYNKVAERLNYYDRILCLGTWSYFKSDGWLKPISYLIRGSPKSLIGVSGSFEKEPHVRGNGWCLTAGQYRDIFKSCKTSDELKSRHDIEVGPNSITNYFRKRKLPIFIIRRSGPYKLEAFQTPEHRMPRRSVRLPDL